jgi:hypothetical protein
MTFYLTVSNGLIHVSQCSGTLVQISLPSPTCEEMKAETLAWRSVYQTVTLTTLGVLQCL